MDRRAFLAGVTAASVGVVGCVAGGSGSPENEYDVGMGATTFEPRRIEVAVGDSVGWRNTNSRAHTVTAYGSGIPPGADYFASGGFDSEDAAREAFWDAFGGAIGSGEEYAHTFDVPGQYDYFCIPHEAGGMVGTVLVRD